jgi:FkbM family methyltransferase
MSTPHGFVMKGPSYVTSEDWEQQEIRLFKKILRHTDKFINVGANVGLYVLLARQSGLPTIALEPIPETVQFLLENLELNSLSNHVTVIPAAAGQHPHVATIYGLGTTSSLIKNWGGNPISLCQKVPVVRLDDVIQKPRQNEQLLVLMDVEGYEYHALQGSLELMSAYPRPIWIIELISGLAPQGKGSGTDDVFSLFAKHGYRTRTANDALHLTDKYIQGVNNYIFYADEIEWVLR